MKNIKEKSWKEVRSVFPDWSEMKDFTWQEVRFIAALYEDIPRLKNQTVRNRLSKSVFNTKNTMSVNVIVSDIDYLSNLMNCLPWYERKSLIYFNLFNAAALEFRLLEQKRLQVENNLYINRAIESLKFQERDLGIKNTNKLSYKQRREQIISRYIGVFDQTNEETIKSICSSFSNGEVNISPDEEIEGLYIIEFVGSIGVPDNISGLEESLEIVFPAHLGFKFKYRFVTWGMLKDKKWKELKALTWGELKTWKEVI